MKKLVILLGVLLSTIVFGKEVVYGKLKVPKVASKNTQYCR